MTLRGYYRRAALAKRDLERANARCDAIGQILWNGARPDVLKRWGSASARVAAVARKRLIVLEVSRCEARDRMLFEMP